MKPESTRNHGSCWRSAVAGLTALGSILGASAAFAQTFNPYATYPNAANVIGKDGAFTPTKSLNFNPKELNIDADGDNVFHFSRVDIPVGVTVTMSARWTNGPVYWLVSGPPPPNDGALVNIAGVLQLSGESGQDRTRSSALRIPAMPGPGGYPGGLSGNHGGSVFLRGAAQSGAGPGGGAGARTAEWGNDWGRGGTFSGNIFLVPLLGGSGGGGGSSGEGDFWGGVGGAGGGALLIASGQKIHVAGQILANGGVGGYGVNECTYVAGSGAGGAIRLVATQLTGGGRVEALGSGTRGCRTEPAAGHGRVRLEAFQHSYSYAVPGPFTAGSPLNAFVPTSAPPSIQVVGIGGQSARSDPVTGRFDPADFTIDTSGDVRIDIEARYVPLKTKDVNGNEVPTPVTLHFFSLEGKDLTFTGTLGNREGPDAAQGTFERSYVTIVVPNSPTVPDDGIASGFSRGFVKAKWTAQ